MMSIDLQKPCTLEESRAICASVSLGSKSAANVQSKTDGSGLVRNS